MIETSKETLNEIIATLLTRAETFGITGAEEDFGETTGVGIAFGWAVNKYLPVEETETVTELLVLEMTEQLVESW